MFVANQFDGWREFAQVIDIGGVSVERAGERPWLVSGCLVSVIEDILEFWVSFEHVCVELGGDDFAMLCKYRDGGLDYLDLL